MPVDMTKCLLCGAVLPLVEFRDVDAPSNHPERRALVCIDCQLKDEDKNFPPQSPWRRAEREVERLFGIPAAAWQNDRASPLGALFYALAARAALKDSIPKRPGIKEIRRNPLHYGTDRTMTVEDALYLCARRGYVPIQGRTYDDAAFARVADAQEAA